MTFRKKKLRIKVFYFHFPIRKIQPIFCVHDEPKCQKNVLDLSLIRYRQRVLKNVYAFFSVNMALTTKTVICKLN